MDRTEILLIVLLILAVLNCISVEGFRMEKIDTPDEPPNCEGMFSIFNKNCRYPRPNYTERGGLQSTSVDVDNKKMAVYCIGKDATKPLLKLNIDWEEALSENLVADQIKKYCWRPETPCPACPVMEEVEEEVEEEE